MKGQMSAPSEAVASMFITLLLLSLTIGNTSLTNQFIKSESLNIQADRVVNGIISIESMPKGFIQMEMSGYGIKVDEGNVSMNYSNSNVSMDLDDEPIQSRIVGPETYQNVEEDLCIRKKEDEIELSPGVC